MLNVTWNLFRVCTECKPVIVVPTTDPKLFIVLVQDTCWSRLIQNFVSCHRDFFFPYGTKGQSRLTSKIILKSRHRTIWTSHSPIPQACPSDVAASTSHGSHRHPMATPRLIPPYPSIRITQDKSRRSPLATPGPRRRPVRPIPPRRRSPPSAAAGASWPHPPGCPAPAV